MRTVVAILAVMLACLTATAETYQYKRVKIVRSGVETACNDDCHYITFTPKGCYESDASGLTDFPDDFLSLQSSAGGKLCYSGRGYYGNARYYFTSDLERLNIYLPGNEIYVYRRQTSLSPAGKMRKPRKRVDPSTGTVTVPSVTPSEPLKLDPVKLPESYYIEHYNRWAGVAQSVYNSLTNLGADIRHRDGSREGYTGGSWEGSRLAEMKGELRKAQREMRDLRSEAARNGYHISPSPWETATVSY